MIIKFLKYCSKLLTGALQNDIEINKILVGRLLSNNNKTLNFSNLHDAEFKVFSQWGDDGIIQYLINKIDIENKYFIEFGVENYTESNTRFLLMNNNWSGLIIDGSENNVNYIKKDDIYWKYDLTAKAAFITAENINAIITDEGINGNIGILSIDIDGNDYWVWKAIEVVTPDIVIIEFNSVFGERVITVPYDPKFNILEKHYSHLYFGASLSALNYLAKVKKYSFIGCNSSGLNAYFVKNEKLNDLTIKDINKDFVKSKFRQARDVNNNIDFSNYKKSQEILKGLPVYNVVNNQIENY